MGFTDNEGKPGNFAEQYNSRRELHLSSLQQKEEEMRQKFVIRVKEKEAELKEAEKEVNNWFEYLCTSKIFLLGKITCYFCYLGNLNDFITSLNLLNYIRNYNFSATCKV